MMFQVCLHCVLTVDQWTIALWDEHSRNQSSGKRFPLSFILSCKGHLTSNLEIQSKDAA